MFQTTCLYVKALWRISSQHIAYISKKQSQHAVDEPWVYGLWWQDTVSQKGMALPTQTKINCKEKHPSLGYSIYLEGPSSDSIQQFAKSSQISRLKKQRSKPAFSAFWPTTSLFYCLDSVTIRLQIFDLNQTKLYLLLSL